jgi:hypothetical protein
MHEVLRKQKIRKKIRTTLRERHRKIISESEDKRKRKKMHRDRTEEYGVKQENENKKRGLEKDSKT